MMRLCAGFGGIVLWASGAWAQPAAGTGPSETRLADAVQAGRIATLAPICGLRDEGWAADLRRSALQSATGSHAHADSDLMTEPGSNVAASALSYAEMEALENFAGAAPDQTCQPLARSQALRRADERVRDFRAQGAPGS
jgi:hypothetical protein